MVHLARIWFRLYQRQKAVPLAFGTRVVVFSVERLADFFVSSKTFYFLNRYCLLFALIGMSVVPVPWRGVPYWILLSKQSHRPQCNNVSMVLTLASSFWRSLVLTLSMPLVKSTVKGYTPLTRFVQRRTPSISYSHCSSAVWQCSNRSGLNQFLSPNVSNLNERNPSGSDDISFQHGRLVSKMVHCCSSGSPYIGAVFAPSAWCVTYSVAFYHSYQWIIALGVLLKATYDPVQGCVITDTDNTLLAATFIYSMCFDFTVLSLTAWKLVINAPRYVVRLLSGLNLYLTVSD